MDTAELSDDVQSWISEDYIPAAKVARSHNPQLQRSNSARYARKLNYSSESEDGLKHVGSEAEFSSPLVSLRRKIEDINSLMADDAPLTSFTQSPSRKPARSRTSSQMSEDAPLTSFNQTPKKETRSRTNTTSRSMIPVSNTPRSKSCERPKANIVSNNCNINRSKSGDRMSNMSKVKNTPPSAIITPRKYSTATPLKYSKSGTLISNIIDQGKCDLEANFTKTPRSLLSNPTSATAKKVLRSKSSDSMMKNIVSIQSQQQLQSPVSRARAKSTDAHSANKVFKSRPKHNLSKSMSTDQVRNNIISGGMVMKPDLAALNGTPKSKENRSFRDWLKRRKNENWTIMRWTRWSWWLVFVSWKVRRGWCWLLCGVSF